MIAAYAQASDRQGLDASVDGRSASIDDVSFVTLREKSAALNLRGSSHSAGAVDVRVGQGVVRLEILGTEHDAESRSPIVIVIDLSDLRGPRAATTQWVQETIRAIGRECDDATIEAGMNLAEQIDRTRRVRLIVTAGGVALVILLAGAAWWSAIVASESGQ